MLLVLSTWAMQCLSLLRLWNRFSDNSQSFGYSFYVSIFILASWFVRVALARVLLVARFFSKKPCFFPALAVLGYSSSILITCCFDFIGYYDSIQ